MHKLALTLALLVAAGLLSSTAVVAGSAEDAMKACEAMTDPAKKEACIKAASGG